MLLIVAHFSTLLNSSSIVPLLEAPMSKYISSACLARTFPEWTGWRSEVPTTYEDGPIPEPWTMLAFIILTCDSCRAVNGYPCTPVVHNVWPACHNPPA